MFPAADVKFVIEADASRRAQRRLQELRHGGEAATFEKGLAEVRERDAKDARQWSQSLEPGAAVRVNTTHMAVAEVVVVLEAHVRRYLDATFDRVRS